MASKVFFTDMRVVSDYGLLEKLDALMKRAEMHSIDFKDKLVAVKITFAERGNMAYIRPGYIARVVKRIQELGGKPFLVDSNTLYYGSRSNAVDHLETAMLNGFNRIEVGCNALIADGLTGLDSTDIEINQKYVKTAKIGSAIAEADVFISVSHFKGHQMTGFGGAIKNIGMGSGSRRGKMEMHAASKPKIQKENCVSCGKCIQHCAQSAISYDENKKAQIDYDKCVGCGQCVASCHFEAAVALYDENAATVGAKMAEYTYAVLLGKPNFHINIMMDIGPECDCWSVNDQALVPNIGMAASFDPVALDRACVDMVNQAPSVPNSALYDKKEYKADSDKFEHVHPDVTWRDTLVHAEEIGVGTQAYELVKIK